MKSPCAKKSQINSDSIERLITLFLPPGKIGRKADNELRLIAETLDKLLEPLELQLPIEWLFRGFQNLSYPIAVIEPLAENVRLKPYLDTNSNLIYIGVDGTSILKLRALSKKMAKEKSLNSKQFELLCDKLMSLLLNNKVLAAKDTTTT
jgi:hypothetical protein